MPLIRLACRSFFYPRLDRASIRMASTSVVGQSGREYVRGKLLHGHRQDPNLSIYQAHSEGRLFVLKRVSESIFNLSRRLGSDFAGSRRLRMHTDYNQEEHILVYDYFRHTFLALFQDYPDFPVIERKKILRFTAEAVQELHANNWIHIDVKPDNILVNWTHDEQGNQVVTDVTLGDFDIAFKMQDHEPLRTGYAIGNVMWRSPEGQTGRGVTKASDVYSFGLVGLYALGGEELLLLNNWQELQRHGITPEQEILTRHFLYFGPVPHALFDHVNDATWNSALKKASEIAEIEAGNNPEARFEYWGNDLGPEAKDLISGMTNLDPARRITMDEVLKHEWWNDIISPRTPGQ